MFQMNGLLLFFLENSYWLIFLFFQVTTCLLRPPLHEDEMTRRGLCLLPTLTTLISVYSFGIICMVMELVLSMFMEW